MSTTCALTLSSPHTTRPANYTLSLHDALPILQANERLGLGELLQLQHLDERLGPKRRAAGQQREMLQLDRKSTRLNSSHSQISYAVFCLKKKSVRDDWGNWRGCDKNTLLRHSP